MSPAEAETPDDSAPRANTEFRPGIFSLVAEALDVRADLPYFFSPTLRLNRASDQQLQYFDMHFRSTVPACYKAMKLLYELAADPGGVWAQLPRDQWRYFVVEVSGIELPFSDFQLAANLGEPPLTFFSTFMTREPFGQGQMFGYGIDTLQATEWYTTPQNNQAVILDLAALANLARAYEAVLRIDSSKHAGIVRGLNAFQEAKRIPRGSDLLVLALFSVIEMLLTHNPNAKEIGDSLMHQIRTKVALLGERFGHKLNYLCFSGSNEDKVWTTLYKFRSLVAHGGVVDFKNKDLRLLVSRENALSFLQVATRRLLRHALEEPSLVDALKPI